MYNHAPKNYACPFCFLAQGTENKDMLSVQSDVIYHDNMITAFVGSHQWPNNHGNVIIVPNEHYENIFDLPIKYAQDIHGLAKGLALAMKTVYSCDGISTRQHNEPAGNQDVWHYHLHVTPRYENDNFYAARRELMSIENRAEHAKALRRALMATIVSE